MFPLAPPPVTFIGEHTTTSQWHHRLGHLSLYIVQSLLRRFQLSFSSFQLPMCSACRLAKSQALPLLNTYTRSTAPLDIVHADLWGPSPVLSHSSFRYYIAFVDDFSRFTWLYPLKLKSDVYATFLQFQKLVENLFSSTIKCVQSNWGVNFSPYILIFILKEYYFGFLVHMYLNTTVLSKESTDTLLKQASLYSLILPSHDPFGQRPSTLSFI